MSDAGTAGAVTVHIENVSHRRVLELDGRVILEIGTGEGSAALVGPPLDTSLNPGGSTSSTFLFRLPSGSYALRPTFQQS